MPFAPSARTAFTVTAALHALSTALMRPFGYGIHRDELYYISCGQRPSFGYVDQPILVPLVAAWIGPNAEALRGVAALAHAAVVAIAVLAAQRLRPDGSANGLALLASLLSPFFLVGGALFGTVAFEIAAAGGLGILSLNLARRSDLRIWAAFGAVALLGTLAKLQIAPFAVLLVVGLLVWGPRPDPRGPALAALGLIAGLTPMVVWQSQNGWPLRTFAANIREDTSLIEGAVLPWPYLGLAVLPLAITGAIRAFRDPDLHPARPAVLAWGGMFALAFLAGGRPYYSLPAALMPIVAGAVGVSARRNWIVAISITGLLTLPVGLALVPAAWLSRTPLSDVINVAVERVGWSSFVQKIESVAQREGIRQVLVTNYGQAGALQLLGDGRTQVLCGHNQYAFWSSPPVDSTILAVAYPESWLRRYFNRVEPVGTIETPFGVENEESGVRIYRCSDLRTSDAEFREARRHFN